MRPYMEGKKEPALKNYYILVWPGGGGTLGARALDQASEGLEKSSPERGHCGIPDTGLHLTGVTCFSGFGDGAPFRFTYKAQTLTASRSWQRSDGMGERIHAGNPCAPGSSLEETEPELRLIPNDRNLLEKVGAAMIWLR